MRIKNISLICLAFFAKKALSDCSATIKELGYPCCTSCIVHYNDASGLWGVENGNWCGIQDYCTNLPTDCPEAIKNAGYVCCRSCDVTFTDESGEWGIENGYWCGITDSCKKKTPEKTKEPTKEPTNEATTNEVQSDFVDPNRVVQPVVTSNYSSGVSVHDPSVVKHANVYYIFGSHMDVAYTTDLWTFKKLYTGVDENNKMFTNLFSKSNYGAFRFVGKNSEGGYSVWAPDVMYNNKMKKWVQYFCTSSTYIKSSICYALADNVEGPYTYQDCFIFSGMDRNSVGLTNVKQITGSDNGDRYFPNNQYNNRVYPNAIDPNVFYDFNGKLWLTYGSWSGGIYILELNESTGLPLHNINNNGENIDKYYGKKLAGGGHQSIEGPYILPHKAAGYYYLFVSYGTLTSNGGYQIRLFRSKNPDGPYTDVAGNQFMGGVNSNFGVKIMGNYNIPGRMQAYMAPGHNSALIDDDGKVLLFYHTRFNDGTEYHEPRIHQMFLNKEGWLVAAPYAYTGETISPTGYSMNDMVGSYKILFHFHTKVNGDISNNYTVSLNQDFTVTGKYQGTWSYDKGTAYMTITIGNIVYSGVFVKQLDEAKSAAVTSFTAIGSNNDSIWGVRF